jgi:hypothetical protein
VGREQVGCASARHQLAAQIFGRAVQTVARVAFQRDDLLCNELPRALAQGCNVGWYVEVHARFFR